MAHADHSDESRSTAPFASNEVWLSPRQWLIAAVLLAGLFGFIPVIWERVEPLQAGADYRLPYRLGHDYWTYDRYCREASSRWSVLVIGDSVIWGHYVAKEQTLTGCLNRLVRGERFANLGVDGIEPAAMAGLVRYYGRGVRGKDLILHGNLLWMADKRRDLQTEKERPLNHPRLLPQFHPRIPCYKETVSGRLRVVADRSVPFFGWGNHLQIAYFDDTDFPRWTLEHPYANPWAAVTLELPSPDEPPSPAPVAEPWTAKGLAPMSFPWVELDTSIQWRFFRRTIELLRRRGNRVFVLLGPFNEHILTEKSREAYGRAKRSAEDWLRRNDVAYYAPPPLPSETYADASHPLARGYLLLARQLLDSKSFARFRSGGEHRGGKLP